MYSLVVENEQVLNKNVLCFKSRNVKSWDLDSYL